LEDKNRSKAEPIDQEECLELLQHKSKLGRVAFIVDGRPIVLPVNYRADPDSIVFCTPPGTKLAILKGGAPVAFEVDASVSLLRSGWSVLVQGIASEVTDPDQLEELSHSPLQNWASPEAKHWISISIDEISGRRIPDD
jgi:nitroimidazol reductase NimA-like FMN-containing flavoprotein (pyridoxamine 5'-phosphate oxidase superfamily)